MRRDPVLLRKLPVRDRQRLRQRPRRRVQEVERQRAGVHGFEDRGRGQARALPHVEQRGHVDVAFLVGVVVAKQGPKLMEAADVVVLHPRPPDELLARDRHENSSSRRSMPGPSRWPAWFSTWSSGLGIVPCNPTISLVAGHMQDTSSPWTADRR
jgi:hypothetical protein